MESYSLYTNDVVAYDQIKIYLKKRLNQFGFHETFKALKKLGKGNFAHVYLVENKTSLNRFAVKAFSKETAYSQKNGKESVINEIEIMKVCDHNNVIRLYEIFETDNSLYIILDYLSGGPMSSKVKKNGKLAEKTALRYLLHLLKGVNHLHDKGVMHRDLKPDNVMFRNETSDELVIVDFGLASFVDVKEYIFSRCGTPGYVAPEVANLKDPKAKYSSICDVFSLGVILHLMYITLSLI